MTQDFNDDDVDDISVMFICVTYYDVCKVMTFYDFISRHVTSPVTLTYKVVTSLRHVISMTP